MNIATHIQWQKGGGGGGGGQSFANFRQICFDFAYFFNNHGKVRKRPKQFFTNATYQTIRQIQC